MAPPHPVDGIVELEHVAEPRGAPVEAARTAQARPHGPWAPSVQIGRPVGHAFLPAFGGFSILEYFGVELGVGGVWAATSGVYHACCQGESAY